MASTLRSLVAIVAAAGLLVTGCSRDIPGSAVKASGAGAESPSSGDGQCATVDTPLADIPAGDNSEPLMRIPVPQRWKRNSTMDSKVIRYAIVSQDLVSAGFSANAVVTLESVRGKTAADVVFEENRANLVAMLGASDLKTEKNTTCGLPSETTDYTAPPMGPAPERPIIMHAVVATTPTATYLATLTIQTVDGADPTYQREAKEIVDGFQMLAP